jgi:methylation protein EvaC
MTHCRICQQPMEPFISFGPMPIANGFLAPEEFSQEYFYDLAVCFCGRCGMVQLQEQPDPARLFHSAYPFLTGTSQHMQSHFSQWTESLQDRVRESDAFVIEIGCNDGTLLRPFAERGIRHLGVDPSRNVSEFAREHGVQTLCTFFDEETAALIKGEHGAADLILAANVMCHIPDLHSSLAGIRSLLKPSGWFVFEEPYLGDVMKKTAFDQFYDEHVFLFSLRALQYAFSLHGLEIFHAEPQWTHGGSMRYFAGLQGEHPTRDSLGRILQEEAAQGLSKAETYAAFAVRCDETRMKFQELLDNLKRQGKRVAGYAATSKSTTLLNYAGITPRQIDGIYDTTPMKQGKFSPGVHLPILPDQDFSKNTPDYAVLFAWNHAEEIFQKEKDFQRRGGKWILFVPEVRVL